MKKVRIDGQLYKYENILADNKFFGAVNPVPYMETEIPAIKFAGLWKQTKELAAKVADFIANQARGR